MEVEQEQKKEWKELLQKSYYDEEFNIDAETFAQQFQQLMEHPNKNEFIDYKDDKVAAGWTMLICVCCFARLDIAQVLLDNGADINIANKNGWTALLLASRNGHNDIVKLLLLKHGADCNVVDKNGTTALMKAAWNEHNDTVKLLLEHGADVNIGDKDGKTVLMMALAGGQLTEIAKLLMEKGRGADLNIADKIGMTALMWACWNGHNNVVKFLLEHGADHTIGDKNNGMTALMWACLSYSDEHRTETVKLLMENGGADHHLNIADKNGKTALRLACERSDEKIVRLLLSRGANANAKDKAGETPLHVACKRNQIEISSFQ